MEKFTFTNEGFIDLQALLYQCSDELLEIEGQLVRNDFNSWIKSHFELTAGQNIYLTGIHPKAKTLIEALTSFAIENRLPIKLNKLVSRAVEDQGKIIWPTNTLTATSGGSIGYTASGTLEINIEYED